MHNATWFVLVNLKNEEAKTRKWVVKASRRRRITITVIFIIIFVNIIIVLLFQAF
jgi:hypothetical protein